MTMTILQIDQEETFFGNLFARRNNVMQKEIPFQSLQLKESFKKLQNAKDQVAFSSIAISELGSLENLTHVIRMGLLDLSNVQHRRILYLALSSFGHLLFKNKDFKDAFLKDSSENPRFGFWIKQIKSLLSDPDYAREFVYYVKNDFVWRDEEIFKEFLKLPAFASLSLLNKRFKDRVIKSVKELANNNLDDLIFAKFSGSLFEFPKKRSSIFVSSEQGTLKTINYFITSNEIGDQAKWRNINALIDLQEQYKDDLDKDFLMAMFTVADTSSKFAKVLKYAYTYKKELLGKIDDEETSLRIQQYLIDLVKAKNEQGHYLLKDPIRFLAVQKHWLKGEYIHALMPVLLKRIDRNQIERFLKIRSKGKNFLELLKEQINDVVKNKKPSKLQLYNQHEILKNKSLTNLLNFSADESKKLINLPDERGGVFARRYLARSKAIIQANDNKDDFIKARINIDGEIKKQKSGFLNNWFSNLAKKAAVTKFIDKDQTNQAEAILLAENYRRFIQIPTTRAFGFLNRKEQDIKKDIENLAKKSPLYLIALSKRIELKPYLSKMPAPYNLKPMTLVHLATSKDALTISYLKGFLSDKIFKEEILRVIFDSPNILENLFLLEQNYHDEFKDILMSFINNYPFGEDPKFELLALCQQHQVDSLENTLVSILNGKIKTAEQLIKFIKGSHPETIKQKVLSEFDYNVLTEQDWNKLYWDDIKELNEVAKIFNGKLELFQKSLKEFFLNNCLLEEIKIKILSEYLPERGVLLLLNEVEVLKISSYKHIFKSRIYNFYEKVSIAQHLNMIEARIHETSDIENHFVVKVLNEGDDEDRKRLFGICDCSILTDDCIDKVDEKIIEQIYLNKEDFVIGSNNAGIFKKIIQIYEKKEKTQGTEPKLSESNKAKGTNFSSFKSKFHNSRNLETDTDSFPEEDIKDTKFAHEG